MTFFNRRRPAFSMIEVLFVLGLIAMLLAFLFPAVQKVREAAARTQCQNNEKQQALGCHAFHDTFKRFPFNGTAGTFGDPAAPGSGSWVYQILPFVEQQPAFQRPKDALNSSFAVFLCPARGRIGATTEGKMHGAVSDYAINTWLNDPKNGGVSGADRPTKITNITDGTSNTLLIGELAMRPADFQKREAGEGRESIFFGGTLGTGRNQSKAVLDGPKSETNQFGSPFRNGTNFAFCDGSVRFIVFSFDLRPALTPDGGEVFNLD
ncbi:MAG: DUF1559 domain-containing protein [Gemmataceae bacterium]